MKRSYITRTHIGWRPAPELRQRWLEFLKQQPPINRSEFLNQMLTYYLDQVEHHGLDLITLRPKDRRPAVKRIK